MNKFLWLIILILWLILGYWLCKKYICGNDEAVPAPVAAVDECATWNVRDGNSFSFTSNRYVQFLSSSYDQLTNANSNAALDKTAEYLKANTDKSLTITGYYDGSEENTHPILPNLGMARAANVKEYLTGKGVASNQINTSSELDNSNCYSGHGHNHGTIGDHTHDKNGAMTGISSGGSKGTTTAHTHAGSGHIKGHGHGHDHVHNSNGSIINSGANGHTHSADGHINGSGVDHVHGVDTLRRGVGFAFGALGNDDSRLTAIKDRLFGKPVTLYFVTNSDTPIVNAQQRQDLADLFYYLDKVPSARLGVSGHTDNVGNLQYNLDLSKRRANDIKNYLQKNGGVSLDKMNTNGFGPNKPIAPNDSAENKSKNRRVEVTLR